MPPHLRAPPSPFPPRALATMGVRNLYTLLHPHSTPETFFSTSTSPTPLYIDGPALCHHIYYSLFTLSPSTHAFASVIPYAPFAAAFLDYLTLLTTSGFSITRIYFDGALPTTKISTRLDRLSDSLKKLQLYRNTNPALRNTSSATFPADAAASFFSTHRPTVSRNLPLPAPPFIVLAAQRALCAHPEYSAVTFTVPGEADPFLARDAVSADAMVLTGDSDLLVFAPPSARGVLMLRDLEFPTPGSASAHVFRPERIAKVLGEPIIELAHQLMLDPSVGLGVLRQRMGRVRARRQAGVGEEKAEQEWKVEYVLPGPGGEARCVEPRISELMQLGEGEREMYLPVLWEDVQRASAWEVGVGIRAKAYNGTVTEIRRKGQRIARVEVGSDTPHADPTVASVLADIYRLSNPALSQADLAAVADSLISLGTQRSGDSKERTQWNWHRAHLFAMASAGWYSLLLSRELCGTSTELPLLEPDLFLAFFESQSGEALKMAKEVKRRAKIAERAEEEATALADAMAETEVAAKDIEAAEETAEQETVEQVLVVVEAGNGKRKSLGESEGRTKKKGKAKRKGKGMIIGSGNMFAALV